MDNEAKDINASPACGSAGRPIKMHIYLKVRISCDFMSKTKDFRTTHANGDVFLNMMERRGGFNLTAMYNTTGDSSTHEGLLRLMNSTVLQDRGEFLMHHTTADVRFVVRGLGYIVGETLAFNRSMKDQTTQDVAGQILGALSWLDGSSMRSTMNDLRGILNTANRRRGWEMADVRDIVVGSACLVEVAKDVRGTKESIRAANDSLQIVKHAAEYAKDSKTALGVIWMLENIKPARLEKLAWDVGEMKDIFSDDSRVLSGMFDMLLKEGGVDRLRRLGANMRRSNNFANKKDDIDMEIRKALLRREK